MRTKPSLDLRDADAIAAACRAAAIDAGARVSIAVVDEAGGLLHFQRLDGARAYSADLAIRKARTAASVGVPTRMIEAMARAGQPMSGEVLAVSGGVPVLHDGQCAGAVGVSGASGDEDVRIAEAGLPRAAGL